jgi:hypothetical protein
MTKTRKQYKTKTKEFKQEAVRLMVDDWAGFHLETDEEAERNLRKKTRTGRPTGDDRFVLRLEVLAGRALRVKPPGRRRD